MASEGGSKQRFEKYCRGGDRGFRIGGRGEKGVAEMKRERRLEAHWQSPRRLSETAQFVTSNTTWFILYGWIQWMDSNSELGNLGFFK